MNSLIILKYQVVFFSNIDICCTYSFTLQFGNKVGDGFFRGKSLPTYVYPHCLKMAVREMVGGELKDYQDPEGSAVSNFLFQSFLYIFPILAVVVQYFLYD